MQIITIICIVFTRHNSTGLAQPFFNLLNLLGFLQRTRSPLAD
jgi:hypothetical protein